MLVSLPASLALVGAIPASGTLSLTVGMPPLTPLDALTVHVQALIGTPGHVVLAGATPLVVIDQPVP